MECLKGSFIYLALGVLVHVCNVLGFFLCWVVGVTVGNRLSLLLFPECTHSSGITQFCLKSWV